MRTKVLLLIASLLLALSDASFAQRGGKPGNGNFYFSLEPGVGFNAKGKNISLDLPTLGLEVGRTFPLADVNFYTAVRMRALTPYSPALLDSSKIDVPADSVNGTGAWSYYEKWYEKSAALLLTVGFTAGENSKKTSFCGGINTAFGVNFVERRNKLGTFSVWDFSLEGGLNVKKFSAMVTSTYSYMWNHKGGELLTKGQNGFAVILGLKLKLRF